MKKHSIYKKVLFISLVFLLAGCSKKAVELNDRQLMAQIKEKEVIFNSICFSVKNTAENKLVADFYYPEKLKTLLSRKCISNGIIYYKVEDLFPENKGLIDSYGFYIPSDDTGIWVDALLIKIEEERIAEELSQMEENLDEGEIIPEPDYAEEIEKVFSEEIQTKEIPDKNNMLKFMEYDKEVFIPQKTSDGYIIIHSAGDKTTRSFYDENYRITTKENWKISGASNSELEQTENFEYGEESNQIVKKIITTKNTEKIVFYNEEKLVAGTDSYIIYEDEKYLTGRSKIKYNEDKKVSEDFTKIYYYNNDYSKRTDTFSKKYTYTYNEDEEIPPDFEYFEEGVLKMKNKYSIEKGTYTSQIFFEGGLSVKTYYEDSIRVKDVYTKDDEVIRVKEYEN